MGQIGTLITGVGVVTTIAGLSQCDQFLLLGTVATANPLQGLQVEVDSTPFINIAAGATGAILTTAFSKWMMETVNSTAAVGVLYKLTTGRIPRNTTIRLTNNGATTPNIYAFSAADNGVPWLVATKTINASSYEDFAAFSALFIATPMNVGTAEITFMGYDRLGNQIPGIKSTLAGVELDAFLTLTAQVEGAGQLAGVTVLDNTNQQYYNVRLNMIAANTVMVAKLPDAAFAAIRNQAQRIRAAQMR